MQNLRLSFPKTKRLLKSHEYSLVFKRGYRVSGGGLVAIVAKNDLGFARLGLAISKKVLSRACDRNLIKRLIRENFRNNQHELGSKDIIFILSKRFKLQTNAEMNGSITDLLTQIANNCRSARTE